MSATTTKAPVAPLRHIKSYRTYKDSGIEWLGKIPAHWKVRRLRCTVTSCQNGVWGDEPDGVYDLACVRVADFDRVTFRVNMSDPTLRAIEPAVASVRLLHPGDLLLEKSGGGENQPVGVVVLFDHSVPAVCSNFVARVTIADGYDARFLTYLHAALYSMRINTRHIKQSTGIQNLDSSSYLTETIALPPDVEQRAIAAFLDRETARIDALVAKKERLIELLLEERTTFITRAVTKGLNHNVSMKDSGVAWLGEIPAHWNVVRAKYTLKGRISGPFGSSLMKESYGGRTYRVYGQEQVIRGDFTVGDYYIPETKFRTMTRYAVAPGDVLVSCVGTFGKAAVVPDGIEPGIINPRLILLRPDSDVIEPNYLELFLKSELSFAQMDEITRGGTMDIINLSTISALIMPLPPQVEQTEILKGVQAKSSRLDDLLVRSRDAIDRLKELRTALISAAATGKIDVREEAS